jgi:hypothetical protein
MRELLFPLILQANPKSTSFILESFPINKFSGLISKCAIPLDYKYSKPNI